MSAQEIDVACLLVFALVDAAISFQADGPENTKMTVKLATLLQTGYAGPRSLHILHEGCNCLVFVTSAFSVQAERLSLCYRTKLSLQQDAREY